MLTKGSLDKMDMQSAELSKNANAGERVLLIILQLL